MSLTGLDPGGAPGLPGFSTGLAVPVPMARSTPDLMAALKVLGGPERYKRKAWSWELPPPRKRALKHFRIGYVLDSPMASPTSEVRPVLDRALRAVERAGAQLRGGWPPGYELDAAYDNYMFLLSAFTFMDGKEHQHNPRDPFEVYLLRHFAAGALCSYADWQKQHFRQLSFRAMWQKYGPACGKGAQCPGCRQPGSWMGFATSLTGNALCFPGRL